MSEREDRGSAAVWLIALAMVLWSSTTAVVLVGVAIAARHRAATAADLAALAAATVETRAAFGGDPATSSGGTAGAPTTPSGDQSVRACAAAEAIAVANDATVVACRLVGSVVEVTAVVRVPGVAHLALGSVSAKARAGPS
jgi:hypothetical protein